MKTKMNSWIEAECDLSEYPKEVTDYVLDQISDRLETTDLFTEMEIEVNHDKQTVKFTSPIVELIQRIIEEKEADMTYEEKHEEQNLER